jgi:hypothetical protein
MPILDQQLRTGTVQKLGLQSRTVYTVYSNYTKYEVLILLSFEVFSYTVP